MSDDTSDPVPWTFNVLAQGESDRPLYETFFSTTGTDKQGGFREALAFAQGCLKEGGYPDPPVRRWIVTHLVTKTDG